MSLFKVMPINQFILYIVDSGIIFGNLYLYRFLTQNTDKRTKGISTSSSTSRYSMLWSCLDIIFSSSHSRCKEREKKEPGTSTYRRLLLRDPGVLLHFDRDCLQHTLPG